MSRVTANHAHRAEGEGAARESHSVERLLPVYVRVRLGLLATLFLVLHWDILRRLAQFAWTDGNWSHAFLVPLFSLYFVYQRRDQLAEAEPRGCWWGLPVLIAGVGGYLAAVVAGQDTLKGYAAIVELLGLALLLAGPAMMRWLWFPIVYLAFAVKIGEPAWGAIAGQLQQLAAHSAAVGLHAMGIEAVVTETTIHLYRGLDQVGALMVAEACSGMRMLMTFLALATAVAYLWQRPWWARLLLVLVTVPIAVVMNIARVVLLGGIYLVAPQYASGDFHLMTGMLMLVPALGLFLLAAWGLEKLSGPGEQAEEAEAR